MELIVFLDIAAIPIGILIVGFFAGENSEAKASCNREELHASVISRGDRLHEYLWEIKTMLEIEPQMDADPAGFREWLTLMRTLMLKIKIENAGYQDAYTDYRDTLKWCTEWFAEDSRRMKVQTSITAIVNNYNLMIDRYNLAYGDKYGIIGCV